MSEPTLIPPAEAVTRYPLTKLCTEIARSLARIGRVAVEGEVVKPITRPSGWTYFTLADRAARLPVSCPADRARRCREAVHGARVLVTGRMVFSPRNGQLHLEAEEVTPVGEGAIQAAIARTRATLASEGILDRPRRPIPVLPRVIGVICGAEAAVRGDIESVAAERFPGYPIVFRQVTVSGVGAPDSIVRALRHLAQRPEVQVVIVARGGGDPASLLPFSDEEVCRAMVAMPVPVVTAIGHERDHPLCDEVSDLACNTPSLAAIRVVPDEASLYEAVDQVIAGAHALLQSRTTAAEDAVARIDLLGSLRAGVERAGERLARLGLTGAMEGRLASASLRVGDVTATVEALNPQRVLERGYAVAMTANGEVLRSSTQVNPGDGLAIRVAEGRVDAVVTRPGDR